MLTRVVQEALQSAISSKEQFESCSNFIESPLADYLQHFTRSLANEEVLRPILFELVNFCLDRGGMDRGNKGERNLMQAHVKMILLHEPPSLAFATGLGTYSLYIDHKEAYVNQLIFFDYAWHSLWSKCHERGLLDPEQFTIMLGLATCKWLNELSHYLVYKVCSCFRILCTC